MKPEIANLKSEISLIECPRDAMQGWLHFIPTEKKIEYINALLRVGFDTIDFGSFVSPKAIPQMADTKEVVGSLHLAAGSSKLLAIIANERGAQDAVVFDEITYLGFSVLCFRNFSDAEYPFNHCPIAGQGRRDTKPLHKK